MVESLVAFVVLAAGTAAAAQLQGRLQPGRRRRPRAIRGGPARHRGDRGHALVRRRRRRRRRTDVRGDRERRTRRSMRSSSRARSYRIERRIDDAGFGCDQVRARQRAMERPHRRRPRSRSRLVHRRASRRRIRARSALGAGAIAGAARGPADRAPGVPLTARNLGDGRSVWKPVESGADRAACSTTAAAPSSAAATASPRRPRRATSRRRRSPLARPDAGCSSPERSGSRRPRRRARPPPATRRCRPASRSRFATASIRRRRRASARRRRPSATVVDGGLQIDDVPVDATPRGAGSPSPTMPAIASSPGIASSRRAPTAAGRGGSSSSHDGWTIGSSGAARRVCRYVGTGAGAIDANIASGRADIDVGAALIGQNFLVVRGSESCPGEPRTARTEPHQP